MRELFIFFNFFLILIAKEFKCQYNFKVYVYELPSTLDSVRYAREARLNQSYHVCAGCIYEQFSLEFVVHDFFTQFCGRTFNPNDADYFYLPIIRDVEYRVDKEEHKSKYPSETEIALIELLEKNSTKKWKQLFQITDKYWKRNNGADHIIVMPAPVTNFRHEPSRRGYYHYMSHLHTPIFLNIEYSKSFIKEYPICSTKKNIVMPYPSIDPKVFNQQLGPKHDNNRNELIFYRGGNHGECLSIRRALVRIMKDLSTNHHLAQMKHSLGYQKAIFCPVPVGDSPSSKRMYDSMNMGCIPVILSDDLVWAYSIQTGGIIDPKYFSITLPQKLILCPIHNLLKCLSITKETLYNVEPYTQRLPGTGTTIGEIIDRIINIHNSSSSSSISISKNTTIDEISSNAFIQFLNQIDPYDIQSLQRGVQTYSSAYRFYEYNTSMINIPLIESIIPNGGAIHHLSWKLSQIKNEGILNIYQYCREELKKKHNYIGNYPCDDHVNI